MDFDAVEGNPVVRHNRKAEEFQAGQTRKVGEG